MDCKAGINIFLNDFNSMLLSSLEPSIILKLEKFIFFQNNPKFDKEFSLILIQVIPFIRGLQCWQSVLSWLMKFHHCNFSCAEHVTAMCVYFGCFYCKKQHSPSLERSSPKGLTLTHCAVAFMMAKALSAMLGHFKRLNWYPIKLV